MSNLPSHRTDAALAAGRALAWALLIGGWLALAALGRLVAPFAGGLWLPAVWLLGTALALAWAGRRPVSTAGQALLAVGLAGAACLAMTLGGERSLASAFTLALCWSGLLALAATVVRGIRQVRAAALAQDASQSERRAAQRAPLPTGAAAAGALLAWLVFGQAAALDTASLRAAAAWSLPLVAMALAALARWTGQAASPCRSGLFDCAWPTMHMAEWRQCRRWPMLAAALAMLPMMATLPWMAEWCGRPGAGPAQSAAQHLAAMLVPAVLAAALPAGLHLPRQAVAALLALSGVALLAWPGRDGLAAAALLQGLAWSLAWQQRLAGDPAFTAPATTTATRSAAARGLAVSALALLLFGLAMDTWGPQALTALHGLLALAGWAGLLGEIATRARSGGARSVVTAAHQRHEKGGPQAASHAMRAPSAGTR